MHLFAHLHSVDATSCMPFNRDAGDLFRMCCESIVAGVACFCRGTWGRRDLCLVSMALAFNNWFEADRIVSICADLQRQYEVSLSEDLLGDGLSSLAGRIGRRPALIVTTPTVARVYGTKLQRGLKSNGLSVPMLVLRGGERCKTMNQVERICFEAYANGLGRKSVLISFGGGVCTDLVTMAASLVRRGICHIRIPTTLIGQVDAAVGIKGAVNTPGKKSALGCFYAPESVFIDPSFLQTLPVRHLSGGMAEIIKVALACDERLFCLLEPCAAQLLESRFSAPKSREVIWSSVAATLKELSGNLYEDCGYRRLLDFGHTFSPLLEARSGFRIPHGEAVAIDMALTIGIGSELGLLNEMTRDLAVSVVAAAHLPVNSALLTEELCAEALHQTTAHRAGSLNLVMPISLGQSIFIDQLQEIPVSVLRSALAWLESLEKRHRRVLFPRPYVSRGAES